MVTPLRHRPPFFHSEASQMKNTEFGGTALPEDVVRDMQKGIMNWSYRGIPTWKCPFDLAIYQEVIWEIKPRTVIEFGSNRGGSALWFADIMTNFGIEGAHVYSLDLYPVKDLTDPRITFGFCDVAAPEQYIGLTDLANLPKPLLVIDDASHMAAHVLAVLRFVDKALTKGDYLIVEDGALNLLGWEEQYGGGPLRAIRTFLAETKNRYEIDRARCDTYGRNVTWIPEGYLRRVED
jgi:cephalosporin hydroxylase